MNSEQLLAVGNKSERKQRGKKVYTLSQVLGVTGRGKSGDLITGEVEYPMFALSISERIGIFQLCSPVFGVITSRMNRISGMQWDIIPEKKEEDKIVMALKDIKDLYDEFENSTDLKYQITRSRLSELVMQELPEVLPDLSNFDSALLRWKRALQFEKQDKAEEIRDWLMRPNHNDNWSSFIKQYVGDMLIHGSCAIYKDELDGVVENIYLLPGGSVMPMRPKYVGGYNAYVQICEGEEPQIFFADEMSFSNYAPLSARAYGYVPLDALVNKIAETLLFDTLMAEQADGTKPPEKVVIFGGNNPFGDFTETFELPINEDEQKRVEDKINEARKGAIRTLTGYGTPIVLDLTRENTMSTQMERQKLIREEIALVFNLSNLEVNLTGSEAVSGRATSESQERVDTSKGVIPMVNAIQTQFTQDILPFKFGRGYRLEYKVDENEMVEYQKYLTMMQTGLFSVNEIRTEEMNRTPFKDQQFDIPQGAGQQGQPQGGGEDMGGMFG